MPQRRYPRPRLQHVLRPNRQGFQQQPHPGCLRQRRLRSQPSSRHFCQQPFQQRVQQLQTLGAAIATAIAKILLLRMEIGTTFAPTRARVKAAWAVFPYRGPVVRGFAYCARSVPRRDQ